MAVRTAAAVAVALASTAALPSMPERFDILTPLTTTTEASPPVTTYDRPRGDNSLTKRLIERSLHQPSLFAPTPQQNRRFFCKSGYFMHIWPDGAVNGSYTSNSKFGVLEFITTMTFLSNLTSPGVNLLSAKSKQSSQSAKFNIKGKESDLWLCMDEEGNLYTSARKTSECEFQEEEVKRRRRGNSWSVYYSAKYPLTGRHRTRWYIGFDRRTGHPLKAMTNIKKVTKCSTKAVYENQGPTLPLPLDPSLFTTPRPAESQKPKSSSQTIFKPAESIRPTPSYSRRENSRKNNSSGKSRAEIELSSLEAIMLRSNSVLLSSGFDDSRSNAVETGDRIRHRSSRYRGGRYSRRRYQRRKSYERLKTPEDR